LPGAWNVLDGPTVGVVPHADKVRAKQNIINADVHRIRLRTTWFCIWILLGLNVRHELGGLELTLEIVFFVFNARDLLGMPVGDLRRAGAIALHKGEVFGRQFRGGGFLAHLVDVALVKAPLDVDAAA
jgi:hypothetical protein